MDHRLAIFSTNRWIPATPINLPTQNCIPKISLDVCPQLIHQRLVIQINLHCPVRAGKHEAVNSGEGATRTLLADESGMTCLFDRAAGIVYTLPAPVVGMRFKFKTNVTITSNAAKVITNAATVFIVGGVIAASATVADSGDFFTADGSTHVAISSNGSTTGGVIGDDYELVCISSTQWLISGLISGSGTLATPFATS